MNNKSARREAPNVKALLKSSGTLKVKIITTSQYKWQAPAITRCSTPFDVPSPEDINKEAGKFCNPAEATVEKDDTAAPARER